MFGLVISGRPLEAPTQISETQYVFRIPSKPSFSHITLFLLPNTPLPVDVGATVWIQLPQSADFKLLGALSAQKQSAIFKLSGVGNTGAQGGVVEDDAMVDEATAADTATDDRSAGEIVLGVSLEPAAAVEQQLATLLPATPANPQSALVRQQPPSLAVNGTAGIKDPGAVKSLAQKIMRSAFDFCTSYGDGQTVPVKALQGWWNKYEKRLELDPSFLERE